MNKQDELMNPENNVVASDELSQTVASSPLSLNKHGADSYAAVDLGSNSFHLVISRYEHGEFTVVDRKREVVRLAAGLDENNNLSDEVASRALSCLEQFGQLLRVMPSSNVRIVGTNALRRLANSNDFLAQAERALGHGVEIIAGREEARLIYLGVSKWSSHGDVSRLVIDIGGGSTEIIAGKADTAHRRESLEVGCVVLSKQFFSDGVLTQERFDQAKLAAELAIQPVVNQFRLQGWSQVIGCSGTMKSIAQAINRNGLSSDGITSSGLQKLLDLALEAGHIDNLKIAGLTADRTPVFGGGLAIVLALFELFHIEKMSVSDIALREGVLYDLVGRLSAAGDTRDIAVNAMTKRWAVDVVHSEQVCSTALSLYKQVSQSWDIVNPLFDMVLTWAAKLHEVGLSVSHDSYHKHGAYLVENADMAGFAKRDQVLLATLIAGHRRKFPLGLFEDLSSNLVTPAKRIAVLLRLSVLLHRGRGNLTCGSIKAKADGQQLTIVFSKDWLKANPLTEADLKQEQSWLKNVGLKLNFN